MVAAALASREECYCRGRLPDPFLFLPFLNSRKPAPTSPSPQWPPQDSTNSPPPPHVVPVNFPTTTSIPLRSSAHTASPHSVQYRRFCSGGRFAPPRVQPCPCCAWSSPRLDLPFFRDLPRQRSTLVRANADFTCIPESGDVPLYDDDTLVQTVFVPPASNHAYAISSYTSTYEGKGNVFIVQNVYSMDDTVAPLRAMLHSMSEVFSAGNACSRGPQVILYQLQQYLVFLTSLLNASKSAPVRSPPPLGKPIIQAKLESYDSETQPNQWHSVPLSGATRLIDALKNQRTFGKRRSSSENWQEGGLPNLVGSYPV